MKKCTDRKGVTILMALLLLLVASMVSVVILTAATTAARHISNGSKYIKEGCCPA